VAVRVVRPWGVQQKGAAHGSTSVERATGQRDIAAPERVSSVDSCYSIPAGRSRYARTQQRTSAMRKRKRGSCSGLLPRRGVDVHQRSHPVPTR
jgi:hypothetical protein